MPRVETSPLIAPSLTAVLFGLSGCLVDFGARIRQSGTLTAEHAEVTPGALDSLSSLQHQQIPCAWLDELPPSLSHSLAMALPDWIKPSQHPATINRSEEHTSELQSQR